MAGSEDAAVGKRPLASEGDAKCKRLKGGASKVGGEMDTTTRMKKDEAKSKRVIEEVERHDIFTTPSGEWIIMNPELRIRRTMLPSLKPQHTVSQPMPPNLVNKLDMLPPEMIGEIFKRLRDDPISYYNFAATEWRQFLVAKSLRRAKMGARTLSQYSDERYAATTCWVVEHKEGEEVPVYENPQFSINTLMWPFDEKIYPIHLAPREHWYSSWI